MRGRSSEVDGTCGTLPISQYHCITSLKAPDVARHQQTGSLISLSVTLLFLFHIYLIVQTVTSSPVHSGIFLCVCLVLEM